MYNFSNKSIIDIKDFSRIMGSLVRLPNNAKIAVATSGGSDSLALAFVTQEWCKKHELSVVSLIVNHNIRENSFVEATDVASVLKQHNIESVILHREKKLSKQKVQELAREDRYKLLNEYCYKNQIHCLLVAHHLNDQIETNVMRENKGINIVGNSGMSAKIINKDVITLRPLLVYTKQQIQNTLLQYTKTWFEDESNTNTKYDRVKIRENLKDYTKDAIQKILHNIKTSTKERIEIEKEAINYLSEFLTINSIGVITINYNNLIKLNFKIQFVILSKLLNYYSIKYTFIKINKIQKLLADIINGVSRNTLNNCLINVKKIHNNTVLIIKKETKNKSFTTVEESIWLKHKKYLKANFFTKNDLKNLENTENIIINIDSYNFDTMYKYRVKNSIFMSNFHKL